MKISITLTKCCKCAQIKVNNNWVSQPMFLSKEAVFTHTYCPTCLAQEIETVERYAPSRVINSSHGLHIPQLVHAHA